MNFFNTKENRNSKIYVYALLVAMVSLIYCLSIGSNKQIQFCDESYTYESANKMGKINPLCMGNTWITGKDIQWYLSAEGHNPHFGEINELLWADHVPLYFWCIRVMSILFFDSCSPMIGIGVNAIVFSIFSFWFAVRLYQLFQRWELPEKMDKRRAGMIKGTVLSTILVTFLWLQTNVFGVVFTIRPYVLLMSFSVMLLCEYALFILRPYSESSENKKELIWNIVMLTFLAVGGLLSHYHFWILFAFCGLLTWIVCIIKKQWRKALFLILHAICAMGITTALFPQWSFKLSYGRGETAQETVSSISNWIPGAVVAIKQLTVDVYPWKGITWYWGWGISLFIFICAFLIMRKRKQSKYMKLVALLLIEIFLYTCVLSIPILDFIQERYFWTPRIMFALLVYVMIGYTIINGITCISESKNCDISEHAESIVMRGITLFFTIMLFLTTAFSCVKTFSKENMSVLNGTGNDKLIESIKDIPWIVYTKGASYKTYASLYDFMEAENICFIIDLPELPDQGLMLLNDRETIFFTEKEHYEEAKEYLEKKIGKRVLSTQIGTSVCYDIYHFEFE